jgi:GT2 family glycosyltransferase
MPDSGVQAQHSKSVGDSMSSEQPCVGVVVLHWNKITETTCCMQSLSNLQYPHLKFYLVDNGSDVLLEGQLDEKLPNLRIIRSNENIGFAGGCNLGITAAIDDGCEFIWLLNNDTIVEPNALCYLVKKAEELRCAGIIGSMILEQNDRNIINHSGGRIYPYSGLCVHLERGRRYDRARENSDTSPSFVTGCSLLARVQMIREVGMLDERYFLYWEDADWCVRARRMGWEIGIAYESEVYHKSSSSLGSASPLKSYYVARNSLRFVWKLYPWLSPIALVWWPRRHLLNHVFRGRFQHAKMACRGLVDAFLRRVIVPDGGQDGTYWYRKKETIRLGP